MEAEFVINDKVKHVPTGDIWVITEVIQVQNLFYYKVKTLEGVPIEGEFIQKLLIFAE